MLIDNYFQEYSASDFLPYVFTGVNLTTIRFPMTVDLPNTGYFLAAPSYLRVSAYDALVTLYEIVQQQERFRGGCSGGAGSDGERMNQILPKV